MSTRILIAEDSPTQGETLRAMLLKERFDVELTASGEEALAALHKAGPGGFSLVVSDVVMPGIDGYELCRRVKADEAFREVPVVLLTSQTDPMAIVRGLECGADNYVTKPYTAAHLLARVRGALDKYSLRAGSKSSMGINVKFLETDFTITSGKEQILDLFISSIEDVVRTNDALTRSQLQLAKTQKQLEEYADRMARQAQVTAEKYSALMHSASDAIFVLERDGRIADANSRASRLLGQSLPLLGRSLLDFVAAGSKDRLAGRLRALGTRAHITEQDVEFVQSTRESVFCDFSASSAITEEDSLSLVILHDVTERRGFEEGLRRSAERLAEAQAIAGLGSYEFNLVTGVVTWSEQQYRIFGQHPRTYTPTYPAVLDLVVEEDRLAVQRAMEAVLDDGVPLDCEFRLMRSDGSVRYVHVRGETRQDSAGRPVNFVGTVLDITDRRLLQEQLVQAQKMDAIGQLAGGIAHDFNNLLTIIHGNSEMALQTLDRSTTAFEDVTEIRQAAISAAGLTKQLLAFSRHQVLQPRAIQLSSVAEDIQKMLSRLISEKIELVLQLDDEVGWVFADPGQVEQVLINLTVNARDAMPNGGTITIRTDTVRLDGSGEGGVHGVPAGTYERLSVSDTGTGMDELTQKRIFEPFFTTKPTGRGTGLGLSTVHGIVKQSGGEIRVRSELGRGTTFEIYLPHVNASGAHPEPKGETSIPKGSETVLVVEDEAPLRKLARRVLEANGYAVLEADNGQAAIDICEMERGRIQLVVSDVVMPGISAGEMMEGIRARHPSLRFLLMSGYHDDEAIARQLQDARTDFLQKPFTSRDLAAKVRVLLERATPGSSAP